MNTYDQRLSAMLELICGKKPPADLVRQWIKHENNLLQDWVGGTNPLWWLSNIGVIDAAEAAALAPIEGLQEEICYKNPFSGK